jgi:hypothetical protein
MELLKEGLIKALQHHQTAVAAATATAAVAAVVGQNKVFMKVELL